MPRMAPRFCGPTTAFKALLEPTFTQTWRPPTPTWSYAKGFAQKSIPTRRSGENDLTTSTGLAGYLRDRDIDHVTLCGLAFDFCVKWSALDAVANGFGATVLTDACRAIDLEGSKAAAEAELTAAGVTLATVENVL